MDWLERLLIELEARTRMSWAMNHVDIELCLLSQKAESRNEHT